jgi:hypothetical protein
VVNPTIEELTKEEDVEFNGYLHATEPFQRQLFEVYRKSSGWEKFPIDLDSAPPKNEKLETEIYKGKSTNAHIKIVYRFIKDHVRICAISARHKLDTYTNC